MSRILAGPRAKSVRQGGEALNGQNPSKLIAAVAVLLTAGLAVACVVLPQGLPRVAISDIVSALLMLSALYVFASNGAGSKGRTRWFWMLQAIGWGLWFCDQLVWIFFDLVRQKRMPDMYPSDALLFLSGAPMIAGLLLRPHRKPTARSARLGMLDFLLLLLWWLYLYVSFIVCWQYISPNVGAYNRSFDVLAAAETILLSWRKGSISRAVGMTSLTLHPLRCSPPSACWDRDCRRLRRARRKNRTAPGWGTSRCWLCFRCPSSRYTHCSITIFRVKFRISGYWLRC